MTDVSLKDAFDIYQKQSDSLHKLWAYFQIASVAVLGYTVGSDKSLWGNWTYIVVAFGYFIVAFSNGLVIMVSQLELAKFAAAVNEAAAAGGPISRKLTIRAMPSSVVGWFHTVVSVIVLAAIAQAWYDKCGQTSRCSSQPAAAATKSAA
jgi:hypothetical protein